MIVKAHTSKILRAGIQETNGRVAVTVLSVKSVRQASRLEIQTGVGITVLSPKSVRQAGDLGRVSIVQS